MKPKARTTPQPSDVVRVAGQCPNSWIRTSSRKRVCRKKLSVFCSEFRFGEEAIPGLWRVPQGRRPVRTSLEALTEACIVVRLSAV